MKDYLKRVLLLLSVLASLNSGAQTNLDSLWQVWNDSGRPDTTRLQSMQRIIIKGYLYSNPDTAFKCAEQMLAFAEQKNVPRSYVVYALNMMGASCSLRGDNKRAIEYMTKSLKIAEEINDKSVGQCISNIGVIYFEMGDNKKAEEYYLKGLDLYRKTGNKRGEIFALGNLGSVYKNLNQFEKGLEVLQQSLSMAIENGEQDGVANAYQNMGTIYQDMGDLDRSIDYLNKAWKAYEILEDKKGIMGAMLNIGFAKNKQNDSKTAAKLFEDVLRIAREEGFVAETREASQALYGIYKKQGATKAALEMYELYVTMRDSLKNEESQQAVMRQEMEYDYEKQKALDEKEHEKEMAVSAEQENKQRIITAAVGIGLFLVLMFAMFVVSRLRLTRKQKAIIEHQKDIVEEKQKAIIDSITYAQRIQKSLMTTEKYIEDNLKRLNKKK